MRIRWYLDVNAFKASGESTMDTSPACSNVRLAAGILIALSSVIRLFSSSRKSRFRYLLSALISFAVGRLRLRKGGPPVSRNSRKTVTPFSSVECRSGSSRIPDRDFVVISRTVLFWILANDSASYKNQLPSV